VTWSIPGTLKRRTTARDNMFRPTTRWSDAACPMILVIAGAVGLRPAAGI
jgi:hypothetical protein